MRHVSLFTGIGGFDLAFKKAGHETILMCENDPGCQQVLKLRFPGILLISDIASLVELPPDTEIISAGFPCIDLSRAGLKLGIHAGQSSGLVRHVFRLLETAIRQNRPVLWVVFENVEGILDNANGGETSNAESENPAIQYIADALEALGYSSWCYRVVASACTGVPNRRKRLFLVASWSADARDILLPQGPMRCQGGCAPDDADVGAGCFECYKAPGDGINIAMDLGNARCAPSTEMVPTFTTHNRRICLLLATGEMGNLRIEDAERLQLVNKKVTVLKAAEPHMQGFPEGWTESIHPLAGSYVSKVQEEASDKASETSAAYRFRAIANAVTVEVAEWIGRRLQRPQAHRFLGNPGDCPLLPAAQTKEALDTINLDGDPGVWEHNQLGMLQGPTTAQRRSTMHAQCHVWELADHAVCAAQDQDGPPQDSPQGSPQDSPVDTEEDAARDDLPPVAGHGAQNGEEAVLDAAADGCGAGCLHAASGDVVDAAAPEDQQPINTDAGASLDAEAPQDAGGSLATTREARKCTAHTLARIMATSETGEKAIRRADVDGPRAHVKRKRSSKGSDWPRAAWWMRGGQRFATVCSDAPLKKPLKPLHEFIHTLGPMPPLSHLHTYISRMKEQGWNVWRIVKKALDTGHLEADLCSLLQMPDQNSTNKECIGWLVFAPFLPEHPTLLWPSEAIDPLCPPKGRKVPQEAYNALSKDDFDTLKHLQQQSQRDAALYGPNGAEGDAEDQQIKIAVAASVAVSQELQEADPGGGDHSGLPVNGNDGDHAKKATNSKKKRTIAVRRTQPVRAPKAPKVLVNLFSTHKLLWMDRSQLINYGEHQKEQREKAEDLRDAGKLPHARLYDKAMNVADSYLAVQKGIKGSAGEAAKAQTAADAAAQINNMPRCMKCQACISNMTSVNQRRCLKVRAYAASAAGHAGAQVAVMEDKALGARLQVWWAQEEQWFAGTVSAYLPTSVEHKIEYDDGDVEIVQLWAPVQAIRLLNTKSQFAEAYELLCEKNKATAQAAAQHKEELLNGARMAEEGSLTAIEQQRQEQMMRNRDMMKLLVPDRGTAGLAEAPPKKKSAARSTTTKKQRSSRSPTPKKKVDKKRSGSSKRKSSKTDVGSSDLPPLADSLPPPHEHGTTHEGTRLEQLLTDGAGNDDGNTQAVATTCEAQKVQMSVEDNPDGFSPERAASGGAAKPGGANTMSPSVAPCTPAQAEKQTNSSVPAVVSAASDILPLGTSPAPAPANCAAEAAVRCTQSGQNERLSPDVPLLPPSATPSTTVDELEFSVAGDTSKPLECSPIMPPVFPGATPEQLSIDHYRNVSLSPTPPLALLQMPIPPQITPQNAHTQHAASSSKLAAAGSLRLKKQIPNTSCPPLIVSAMGCNKSSTGTKAEGASEEVVAAAITHSPAMPPLPPVVNPPVHAPQGDQTCEGSSGCVGVANRKRRKITNPSSDVTDSRLA